jgi:hypothetical protein
MRIKMLGTLLFLVGCSKPSVDPEPTGDASSDASDPVDTDSSDEGGTSGPTDTSTGGEDTAVAEGGEGSGEEGSEEGGETSGSETGGEDTGGSPVEMMADFQLEDLNPTSPRYGEVVSPRDYMEEVSGWYFIKGS